MIKSKKQMFLTIIIFTLVMMLGTISYAFFNYTRTGSPNNFRVGRISFVSRNEETITISDLFPIDPDEPGIMNDSTKVGTYEIEIQGDTDYSYGLEYLVSTQDVHIYTSEGKTIPISINISVNNLGTEESNYFTERNDHDTTIYKKLSGNAIAGEQQLLVGYIKPNTTEGTAEGINGKITIKAYIDKNKISISNTYDGTESDENGTTTEWVDDRVVITEEEWNALQSTGVSFKIKVEANAGIWVKEPFYDVMQRNSVMDNINSTYVQNTTPGIDFESISSDTNGKGLYTLSSTANDVYPIMYYRGDVDNNVLFGGFCWKIVRTTDTGGIKLIYNGNPVNNQCGVDRILVKNQVIELPYDEVIGYTNTYSDSYEYDAQNKVFRLTGNISQVELSYEIVNSLIGKYTCSYFDGGNSCSTLKKVHSYDSTSSMIKFTQVTQDSSILLRDDDANKDNIMYNSNHLSPASVGYMYGVDYTVYDVLPTSGNNTYYGSSFIYENGVYKLVNTKKSPPNETHHYTCDLTDPNGTCETIRFYRSFYVSGGEPRTMYITLSGGKSVEDAISEMFVNTHDSLAKTMIDTWYSENMINYTNKLEDTIYCNDRNITDLGGFDPTGSLGVNGNRISFSNKGINCPQKKDAFTVSSEKGNGKLDYPVGMLTNDEAILAGAIWGTESPNTSFYLYDGNGYWTMTPCVYQREAYVQRVYSYGNYGGTRSDHNGYMSGFRPVISLKQGTSVTSGNGSPTSPYVIN